MKTASLRKSIKEIAEAAYQEGREHQLEDDFPDVGMHFERDFTDT